MREREREREVERLRASNKLIEMGGRKQVEFVTMWKITTTHK